MTEQKPQKQEKPIPPPPQYLLDSIDETPWQTIKRDLTIVLLRTGKTLLPFAFKKQTENRKELQEPEIFGPILYSVLTALFTYFSYNHADIDSSFVFPTIITMVFVLGLIIALNTQLLGGKQSTLGIISFLGYCCAPLTIASLIDWILVLCSMPRFLKSLLCCIFAGLAAAWSIYGSSMFFKDVLEKGRIFLGVYPVFFFFITLAIIILLPGIKKE